MTPIRSDPRLVAFRSALSTGAGAQDSAHERWVTDERPGPATTRMEAAVALVIRARDDLDFLLIKRATSERDPWSGQMALPGGRWERDDSGLLRTAQRETWEETGIDLGSVGSPLGKLTDVTPSSPRLPPMRIAPYVFGVPADTEARVASPELESVHWVPLDVLRAPETVASARIVFTGFSKTFPSFHVVGEHVWGLTHRILSDFLERYPASQLDGIQRP